MNSADRQRIQHMQTYCRDIAGFIDRFGNNFNTFTDDRAYFNAVSMCVMQIGELANGLSDEFREETKGKMQWGLIRGMRNWLAHAYAEMDENIIWETAVNGIPELLRFCEQTLAQEKPSVIEQLHAAKTKVENIDTEKAQSKKRSDPEL